LTKLFKNATILLLLLQPEKGLPTIR